ncbi:uncharacterized protein LOC101854447 [Aplysia californica]|uniref:Uncharacterized protein LOC101854447 n=1 Tax=Aplysia californica TaxID=6500 RepID=A0ABM1AAJ5_APLCA|nr:uncharacterized protein LOC101854447 [Aplysia californica]
MPLITVKTNVKTVSDDFMQKSHDFFKDLLVTEKIIIDLDLGRQMTAFNSSEPTVTVMGIAVGRFHSDTNPRLHKAIAEFISTALSVPLERTIVFLQKLPCHNVSAGGEPLPEFLARDRDVTAWQD